MTQSIDVVIPVYKPTEKLVSIFHYLYRQTVKIGKVIVVNTEQQYWDDFFKEFDVLKKYPFIELHHISKEEFDHGKTRNLGVSYSDAEFVLLMTDDAIPYDEKLIENLWKNFSDEKVGICYAKQIPHKNCNVIEKYTRSFNYPDKRIVKGKADIETMGIKAFFASNVCSMYRKSIYDYMGGFITRTIFNEDMIYARRMIENDYKIVYEPSAIVRHSHNYSGIMQLKRNFDLGVSHADHPEIFADVKAEGEGIKLVKDTSSYLIKHFMPHLVIKLFYHSACKYLGYRLGKKYKSLPDRVVKMLAMNQKYFEIQS